MKTHLRTTKASGTTKRRVDIIVRAGWRPGLPSVWFYHRSKKHGGHHE